MLNLYDYDLTGLETLLAEWGYSAYHAGTLWHNLYRQNHTQFNQMGDLRPDLREKLVQLTNLSQFEACRHIQSNDNQTHKYLLTLADGETIETVQMGYRDRHTACLSTQVGCAMGCIFCATGQMGFCRHLSSGEIIGQILYVNRQLRQSGVKPLRNVVLMGMGEPLHNYDAVMCAIRIMTDKKGLAIGERYITLSTVGIPPAIRQLADEGCRVNLAVSLHGVTDAEREVLVPVARKWKLPALISACKYYAEKRQRRIFFEWTLIAEKNDTPQHAHALGKLLDGINAHLNLIPLNPTVGYEGQPSQMPAVGGFQAILREYGIPSTVRQRRGIDISAGCGQLRTTAGARRVSPTCLAR